VKSFICTLLVIGAVFLSSEVRQFIHRPYYYIRNIYNSVDVVSLVMPRHMQLTHLLEMEMIHLHLHTLEHPCFSYI